MATLPLSARDVGIIAAALDYAIEAAVSDRMALPPGSRHVFGADAAIRDMRDVRRRLPVPVLP